MSFCLASGATITWDVNGVLGGSPTIGTIVRTGASIATYTAPVDLPSPTTVAIHATSGTLSASASVTIVSNITVAVPPSSATV